MNAKTIIHKYLDFFKSKNHAIIPSASLIPANDASVLFNTAGMQPLVPYLMGTPHPLGKRLVNVQKCLRTVDFENIGDDTHHTFFQMLGNWSLGDYFKREAITWSFELLTSKKWLNISPRKLAVTIYQGDKSVPRDEESYALWRGLGIPEERIAFLGQDNFWIAGDTGPCGPSTEMFYWKGEGKAPACFDPEDNRWVEIWNDVFMQYNKTADGDYVPLTHRNVDTGMGLERITAVVNSAATVFETDAFAPMLEAIEKRSDMSYRSFMSSNRSTRIIADHTRAAVFVLGDARGVAPSNVEQGYVLRRLIRRAVRHGRQLGIAGSFMVAIAEVVVERYKDVYPELAKNKSRIFDELAREEKKFGKTLEKGLREFEKMFLKGSAISGEDAFILYSTYGFPLELTEELAKDRGQDVDRETFGAEFKKHQQLSRAGAEQKFTGGLADRSEETTRLHTATHLLDQALRLVLGDHVFQKGSNITSERLRFDFSHPQKVTPEQLKKIEGIVNDAIKKNLPVHFEIMSVVEAKQRGAIGVFEDTYATLGDQIKVYFIGDEKTGDYFSKEVCGGPHVERTGELENFKIVKEEAVASGIRRIKAVVEGGL